jgi:RsiW-degrading membrane proteinase PrsW (M82 family)
MRFPSVSIFLLFSLAAQAQTQTNVYTISLDNMLFTVLPFYAVTLLGLGLFIHKLMRPAFPSKWMYICSIIGILGAGIIANQFHSIRVEQLPSAAPAKIDLSGIPREVRESIRGRESNDAKESIANYWIVAIPNFIILGLGLGIDRLNRKKELD